MGEAHNQAQIRLAFGGHPDIRMWRNQRGLMWVGTIKSRTPKLLILENYRRYEVGLCNGASDLIGIKRTVVTPEMVGQVVGVFSAIEVKDETGATKEQINFLRLVRELGGNAGVAHGPAEAGEILGVKA